MKKVLFHVCLAVATLAGATACRGGGEEEKTVAVTSVSVSPVSLSLTEGETLPLRASVLPADATDYTLTWTSSDPTVAQVSETGNVSALAPGSATITASAGGKSGTCSIVVAAKVIPVEKIEINPTELSLEEGETADLIATVTPSDATDPTVSWSSSDPEVATVSGQGKVTALKAGSATITAKAGDKTADCLVAVISKVIPVESVSLDYTTLELSLDDTFMLTATVLPANATDASYTWSSSDEDVVTVSPRGVIYPHKVGSVTIMATTTDGGKTASCSVKIYDPALRIMYTTSDHKKLEIDESCFSGILSHSYGDYGLIQCSESILSIGESAFADCTTLTGIELPKSLTNLGSGAFENCSSLSFLYLPSGLTTIGDGVFTGCSQLAYIYSTFATADNRCLIQDGVLKAFAPAGISHYTVLPTISAVAPSTFACCPELASITFLATVSQIGSKAFADCTKLVEIRIESQTPPTLENADAFSGLPTEYLIYVPEDVVDDYKVADGWKEVKDHIKAYEPELRIPRKI